MELKQKRKRKRKPKREKPNHFHRRYAMNGVSKVKQA